jgi:hypothetical protein
MTTKYPGLMQQILDTSEDDSVLFVARIVQTVARGMA